MRIIQSWLRIEQDLEGVRRIPINVRSLTGKVQGHSFESSLERDLLLITHWANDVDWFQTQPVKIEFLANETKCSYIPDLLIKYLPSEIPEVESKKPLLCEVKYRSDFAKDWKLLKPKFKAAKAYAKVHGYEFRVLTEREIRTDFLKNIQFLWSYRYADFNTDHYDTLRNGFQDLDETDPYTLLNYCYESETLRAEGLWTLWSMIARRWIKCDLTVPLNMKTRIWM